MELSSGQINIQFQLFRQVKITNLIMDRSTAQSPIDTPSRDGQDFATKINHKDELKLLKKKLSLLKQAIFQEREKKGQLQKSLQANTERIMKNQMEKIRKQEKNEALTIQIKSLKDALIVERNDKQKYVQRLKAKQEEQKNSEAKNANISVNNYFGLRGLFQK